MKEYICKQQADTIYNFIIEKGGCFGGLQVRQGYLIDFDELWERKFGKLSGEKDVMPFIGREDERKKIVDFFNIDEKFRILAITGRAGNGKSRLVYDVLHTDNSIKKEWKIYGVDHECLAETDCRMSLLFSENQIKDKTAIVIDYVTIDAEIIGKHIKQLYKKSKEDNVYIRIFLIERAPIKKEKEPYWYIQLVKENKLDEMGVENSFDNIDLENMEDVQLQDIFVERIKQKEQYYKKIHGETPDILSCKVFSEIIISKLDEGCKAPLYVIYIADAWIENHQGDKINWEKKEILEQTVKKENHRIESMFKKNKRQQNAFKKILLYAIALNGLDLKQKEFLEREFKELQESCSDSNMGLANIFSEIGNIKDGDEVILKYNMPEIVGEYYCLSYLEYNRAQNYDYNCIDKFIEYGWSKNRRAFSRFLCRIIEDFPEHPIVTLDGLLRSPKNFAFAQETKILFAEVLREYTFWNKDVLRYCEKICSMYNEILNEDKSEIRIEEAYWAALFNMTRWCWNQRQKIKYSDWKIYIYYNIENMDRAVSTKINRTYRGIEKINEEWIKKQEQ